MAAGEQKDKEGSTSTSAGKERAGSSSSSVSRDEAFAARLADPNVGELVDRCDSFQCTSSDS